MTKKPTPQDLQQFEGLLRHMLAVLTGDIQSLEKDALGEDSLLSTKVDDGGEAYAQEFSLELLERDEQTVREIMAALERIGDGSFGRCESCEKWIRKTRLRAVPYARNCIDCQREAERGMF